MSAPRRLRAVLFDLDGVLTPTAAVHMRAWAETFAEVFAAHGLTPPYTDADYFALVDGRPRYEAVDALLRTRGLALPWGAPEDAVGAETVCGIGNRKNARFEALLAHDGVAPYPDALVALQTVADTGVSTAVVSSSRNARDVLAAAGIGDRFSTIVDGGVAAREGLRGKPAPDTFLRAAELLGVPAHAAVVVEDAVAGVAAGRAGRFGFVLGVDRGAGAAALRLAGADRVVDSLTALREVLADA